MSVLLYMWKKIKVPQNVQVPAKVPRIKKLGNTVLNFSLNNQNYDLLGISTYL